MMRVHLRGVVAGVTIVISIAVIVAIFNAFEAPSDSILTRHALSADNEAAGGASPRARQRPAGGARAGGPGARAGGPGARPGGPGARPGGPGARAGGPGAPGARAGGPGAPGARAGGPGAPGARAGGPGARAGGPGARAGGPGARAGGPGARAGGASARAGAAGGRFGGGPGARAGGPGGASGRRIGVMAREADGDVGDGEEDMEETVPRPRARPGGMSRRVGGPAPRSPGRFSADADADLEVTLRPRPVKRKPKVKKIEEEVEEEEKTTEKPKRKEPPYPEWWKTSYPRSAVSTLQGQFVGDQPLFPECPSFAMGATVKDNSFGYVEPPNYMRNSKNPCWFEWNGKKDILKCLPYFYIAGVAKSATADIFNRVSAHPSVLEGGSTSYYWWDRLRYGASKSLKYTREAKRSSETMSLKEYAKDLVGKYGKNLTRELLYRGQSESIFGDASPTYLTENTQWNVFEGNQGCSEPRVIPATFIRHIFPEARIVIVLRDPVERLYSRFLASVPYVQEFENATASLFHTFTVQAVQTYRECFSKYSVRHCAYNASLFSNAVIRMSEGMYSVFLEDWFRVFPKEQILILKFEDYAQDIKGNLIRIFDHLGLSPLDNYNMLKLTDLPITRKGGTREDHGQMMPETVSLLYDFYSPFNLKLADMLDNDTWHFTRDDFSRIRVNLEAHEEGNDAMPAVGEQQEPMQQQQQQEPAKTSAEVENMMEDSDI